MQGLSADAQLTDGSRERLNKAVEIYSAGDFLITSSGYTVNCSPCLDQTGQPICESDVGATYLVKNGIPRGRLFSERFSQDTVGNAFLVRQLFGGLSLPRAWTVVTSQFHLERAKNVFEWVLNLCPKMEVDLSFIACADPAWDSKTHAAIQAKEAKQTRLASRLQREIKTIDQFVGWFFSDHGIYAFDREVTGCKPNELKAYR